MQLPLSLINHEIENNFIPQRASDGYINATAMCKAVGKNFADYRRLAVTDAFLNELSSVMGIPITDIVYTFQGGTPSAQGTWVHPDVAVNLGQWCSPKFAVAVARWVREWMSGKFQTTKLPYHLERYLANRAAIPPTHWSMLNEMTFNLIAPLEQAGYHLPEEMVPDISEGKMFCKWLRDTKKIDTSKLLKYRHIYADGRIIEARLYPLAVLADFRDHFFTVWVPQRMVPYFHERDPKALPYLNQLLLLPANASVDDDTARVRFDSIKATVAAVPNKMVPKKPN